MASSSRAARARSPRSLAASKRHSDADRQAAGLPVRIPSAHIRSALSSRSSSPSGPARTMWCAVRAASSAIGSPLASARTSASWTAGWAASRSERWSQTQAYWASTRARSAAWIGTPGAACRRGRRGRVRTAPGSPGRSPRRRSARAPAQPRPPGRDGRCAPPGRPRGRQVSSAPVKSEDRHWAPAYAIISRHRATSSSTPAPSSSARPYQRRPSS